MAKAKTEEIEKGLTLRVIVLGVITIILGYFWGFFIRSGSGKPGTYYGVMFVPYIWIFIFNEIAHRINPKWALRRAEMVMFLTGPMAFTVGSYFWTSGGPHSSILDLPQDTGLLPINRAMTVDPFRPYVEGLLPEFWYAPEAERLKMFYGLKPGEVINWAAWAVPMTFWILFGLSWAMLGLTIGALLRKSQIETERVAFPTVYPLSYATVKYYDREPSTQRTRFFTFQGKGRAFWIMFVVGLLTNIVPILHEFLPYIPMGAMTWGAVIADFSGWTASVMPGANWMGWFDLAAGLNILIFASTDVLLTITVAWLGISIIYSAVAIYMGAVPYSPGIETYTSWYFGWLPPWFYGVFAGVGMAIGIAVWIVWSARVDIMRALSSLWKKEDYKDEGISMRWVSLIMIGSMLLWVILSGISGIPIVVAIIGVILWAAMSITNMRVCGETWIDPFGAGYLVNAGTYAAGADMGYWKWQVPSREVANVRTWMMWGSANSWNPVYAPWGTFKMMYAFKTCEITKTSYREMFKWYVGLTVFSIVVGVPFLVWWSQHVGGQLNNPGFYDSASIPLGSGIRSFGQYWPAEWSSGMTWLYGVTGAITAIIMYLLRARFPWFFLAPPAFAITIWMSEWIGFMGLVALIIKYIMLRIGGVKFVETYGIEGLIGYSVGLAFLLPFVVAIVAVTTAAPWFASVWVP